MRLYVSLTASLEPIWLKIKLKSINSKACVWYKSCSGGIEFASSDFCLQVGSSRFPVCMFPFFFPLLTVKGIRVKLQKKGLFSNEI
jgi:hypothetical protein